MVKASPKRRKEEEHNENTGRYKSYGLMSLYSLIMLAGLVSVILFIFYSSEAHGETKEDGSYLDPYEHDFGRMTIAAYATIISLLFLIFCLVSWIAYNVHRHYHQ